MVEVLQTSALPLGYSAPSGGDGASASGENTSTPHPGTVKNGAAQCPLKAAWAALVYSKRMTQPEASASDVRNNREAGRYELSTPQSLAFAEYRPAGQAVMFTHTEVPEALEGQGIGSRLVKAALDDARTQGMQVIPMCPFVASYIREHREYLELVDPAQRGAVGL